MKGSLVSITKDFLWVVTSIKQDSQGKRKTLFSLFSDGWLLSELNDKEKELIEKKWKHHCSEEIAEQDSRGERRSQESEVQERSTE